MGPVPLGAQHTYRPPDHAAEARARATELRGQLAAGGLADTTRLRLLLDLGTAELATKERGAGATLRRAWRLARRLGDPSSVALAVEDLLRHYRMAPMYDTVEVYVDLVVAEARAEGEPLLEAIALAERAIVARRDLRFDDGIAAAHAAIELLRDSDRRNFFAAQYNSLGRLYAEANEPDRAIEAFEEAYRLGEADRERIRRVQRGMALYYIGTIAMERGNVELADDALARYQAFVAERPDQSAVYRVGNHGSLALFMRDSALAEGYLRASVRRARDRGDDKQLGISGSNLALFYLNRGQPSRAIEYGREALAAGAGDLETVDLLHDILHRAFRDLGRVDSAYAYLVRYNTLHDSLLLEEQTARIDELRVAYDTERKEAEIELQAAEIVAAEAERRNLLILLGLGSLVIVGLVLGYRYRTQLLQRIADQRGELLERERLEHKRELELSRIRDMLDGQEAERRRVARELHDGLGGLLASTRAHFLAEGEHDGDAHRSSLVARGVELLDNAYQEVRRIAHAMMPQALTIDTFTGAVEDLADDLEGAGVAVQLEVIGPVDERLGDSERVALYRILQELVANTLKHAHASHVMLQLMVTDEEASVVFEDDGRGFDLKGELARADGLGLGGLRSRVDLLGGILDIDSRPGRGTSVTISFPVSERAPAAASAAQHVPAA